MDYRIVGAAGSVAAEIGAGAEAADRARVLYEVQWQAASTAAADSHLLLHIPYSAVGVLAARDSTGVCLGQVTSPPTQLATHALIFHSSILIGHFVRNVCLHRFAGTSPMEGEAVCTQDVLVSSATDDHGGQARLAAAQVAALQKRFAANPASLQLTVAGVTAGHLLSPAGGRASCATASAAASRSLAAMLRVAAVEAPTIAFSMLHINPAMPSIALAPRNPAAEGDGSRKQRQLAEDAGVHGRALSAGMWLAPRLVAHAHVVAGSHADESPVAGIAPGCTEGSVIVTGRSRLQTINPITFDRTRYLVNILSRLGSMIAIFLSLVASSKAFGALHDPWAKSSGTLSAGYEASWRMRAMQVALEQWARLWRFGWQAVAPQLTSYCWAAPATFLLTRRWRPTGVRTDPINFSSCSFVIDKTA